MMTNIVKSEISDLIIAAPTRYDLDLMFNSPLKIL